MSPLAIDAHIGARIEAEAGIGERRTSPHGRRHGDGGNPSIPVVQDLGGSAVSDANGNAWIDLGAPRPGFVWEIRSIFVCSSPPETSISGGATLYVGSVSIRSGSLVTVNPLQARDATTVIPNTGGWGEKQVRVDSQQRITVVFSGVGSGVTVFATGQVEVFATSTYAQAPRGSD